MSDLELPLFPLHTVLFPGGSLPLRIFEARYMDMIGRCMRQGGGFGVCLIRHGGETGGGAEPFAVGTRVRIADWDRLPDGLLGVRIVGERRFRIDDSHETPDHLLQGRVTWLPEMPAVALPEKFALLAHLAHEVVTHVSRDLIESPARYDDADWVAARLAELLPLENTERQFLLELDDPIAQLDHLTRLVEHMRAG
jgi:Lon protease-like protein